jgi:hypothetical protein
MQLERCREELKYLDRQIVMLRQRPYGTAECARWKALMKRIGDARKWIRLKIEQLERVPRGAFNQVKTGLVRSMRGLAALIEDARREIRESRVT